ncbi:hypothetical protein CVS40_2096 [Lucilia cuprina]|nr:hypothetical protein CVS40_2096 [Lucilia cuprina]
MSNNKRNVVRLKERFLGKVIFYKEFKKESWKYQSKRNHKNVDYAARRPHNSMRSNTSSPTSSTSAPPSPPTAMTHQIHRWVPLWYNHQSTQIPPQMPLLYATTHQCGINEPQECPYCRRNILLLLFIEANIQDQHEQVLQHRGPVWHARKGCLKNFNEKCLVLHNHHHHHHHHPMTPSKNCFIRLQQITTTNQQITCSSQS